MHLRTHLLCALALTAHLFSAASSVHADVPASQDLYGWGVDNTFTPQNTPVRVTGVGGSGFLWVGAGF